MQDPAAVVDEVAPTGRRRTGAGPTTSAKQRGAGERSARSAWDQTRAGVSSSVERCSARWTSSPARKVQPPGRRAVGVDRAVRGEHQPLGAAARGDAAVHVGSSGTINPYSGRGW